MSLPKFPLNDPPLTRDDVINQIISSIAMEELGLSHIINAEGEKLQYALGTIPGQTGPEEPLTLEDLLKLNESVHQTLNSTMMNQFFLKEKLLKALSASVMRGPTGPAGPQGPATIAISKEVKKLEPGEAPTVENIAPDDKDIMLEFGIPRGYTGDVGPIGPTGATGADGYAGATGATGATGMPASITVEPAVRVAYASDPYVYNMGSKYEADLLFGIPDGAPGTTGASAYDSAVEHGYSGTEEEWLASLKGPAGPTGTFAPDQELFNVLAPNGSDEVYLGGELAFASDTLNITVEQGPTIKIENPFSPQGAGAIIPFSSGKRVAIDKNPLGTGRYTIATIGFGSYENFIAANDPINLPVPLVTSIDVTHTAFSVPADGTITGLSAFYTAVAGGLAGQKTIITAELYQSTAPDNTFYPVPGAKVVFDAIDGIPTVGETRNGIVPGLKVPVKAGTRLLLVFYCDSSWGLVISITGYMSGGLRIE